MNEQIEEIKKQATIRVPATRTDPHTFMQVPLFNGSIPVFKDEFSLDKFAELIVKACINAGEDAFRNDHSVVPVFPSLKIKEHFGIEK